MNTNNTQKQTLDPHDIIRLVAQDIIKNMPEISAATALNLARIQFDLPVIAIGDLK